MKKSKKRALRIASSNAHATTGTALLDGDPVRDFSSENREHRVKRLYASGGGPLIGWLLDECRVRGMTMKALAVELGVTYGYINQLRNGIRDVSQVSTYFAKRAARFLGIQTVVVKLMTGQLNMSDFIPQQQTEEEFVERTLCRMMEDPKAGTFVSLDVLSAELAVKKDFLALYAEVSGDDVYSARELPEMVRWLQSAAAAHSENLYEAKMGNKELNTLAQAA